MGIKIIPYESEHEEAVRAFNGRLAAANLDRNLYSVHFPDSHISEWLPKQPGRSLYEEYFVAVDDQSIIRGGYVLKHQPCFLKGNPIKSVLLRLPISEGIINRDFTLLGVRLYKDAIRRHSLLWCLGGGGLHTPIAKLLLSAGWQTTPVPFWFRIVNPNVFLRNIEFLRSSPLRRIVLESLRCSGLGWLGIKAWLLTTTTHQRPAHVSFEIVPEFTEWADGVWNRCKSDYSLIAVRDQQILQWLYPATDSRFIRLKIIKDHMVMGWAVLLHTQMSGNKYFGNMRVGTLVDCLAKPDDARDVVACAREVLEANGTDLIVSNQASQAWCQTFRSGGFIEGPSNFPFFASPQLASLLHPLEELAASFHLNRGDGDGPIHL